MSLTALFLGIMVTALVVTFLARYTAQLLVRIAAALLWLTLGMYLLVGGDVSLNIADTWVQVLGFVFVIMTIVPLTWQVKSDIRHERATRSHLAGTGTTGATSESWSD